MNKKYYTKNKHIKIKTPNINVPNTRQQYFEGLILKNDIPRIFLKALAYYYPDELKKCVKLRDFDQNIKNYKEGKLILIMGINVIDMLNDEIINVLKDLINKETIPLPIEKCIIRALKDGATSQGPLRF